MLTGDAKIYDVFQSLKHEYGAELKWLLPYPGDWHLLFNYQSALIKPYFDAGLKELAQVSGYPVAAIQNCSEFKRTHCFLMEVWQALYQIMVEKFLQSCAETPDTNLPPELITTIVQNAYLQPSGNTETDLGPKLRQLHEAVMQSGFHTTFSAFLDDLSAADLTWKFWVQFVFVDAMAYVSLYLAIRSGNWEVRLASIKLMAATFSAFDHLIYRRLIAQHLADVASLPPSVLSNFCQGGFAVGITGRAWHSVAIDGPDTDIYHIGLPLNHGIQKEIIVQLNPYSSKDLSYLHMTAFVTALSNDPDLSSVPSHTLPQVFQTIFTATGCDYTSFFSGIGKATFLRYFYENAEFITSGKGNAPGTLADIGLQHNTFDKGVLVFLCFVGVVYFKKHASEFSTSTPTSHFNKLDTQGLSPTQKHQQWLDDIRQHIWDRVQFENEMIPNTEALYHHWKRTCWVIDT